MNVRELPFPILLLLCLPACVSYVQERRAPVDQEQEIQVAESPEGNASETLPDGKSGGIADGIADEIAEESGNGDADEGQAKQDGDARDDADAPHPSPPRPKVELSQGLLYKFLLAEFAGHQEKLDIAVHNYLGLAKTTRDPLVAARAARVAVYARDDEASRKAAQLWLELDPNHPDPHHILTMMAIRAGEEQEAVAHMRNLIENLRGDTGRRLWVIANLVRGESKQNGAIRIVRELMRDYAEDVDALEVFGSILAYLDDMEEAIATFDRVLELKPDSTETMLNYMNLLLRNGMDKQAAQQGKAFVEQSPDHLELRHAYARALMQGKDYAQAREQFLALIEKKPHEPQIMYSLGMANMLLDQLDEAKDWFMKAWEEGEKPDTISYFLGRIAEAQDRHDDAIHWYGSVRHGDSRLDARMRMSMVMAKQGDMDKALQYIRSIQPRHKSERLLLIQAETEILVNAKRLEEAMSLLTREIESSAKPARDILYARAMLAERQDRLDLVERDLRSILAENPEDATALNALGYTLADRTDRYQEAHALIKRALELSNDDELHYVLDSMGWILYRLGRMDEAVDYLRRALAIQHDPEVAAHLGEVLWVMGDEQAAREVWDTALESTPENDLLREAIQRFTP